MEDKLTNPFALNRTLEVVCIKQGSEDDTNTYVESNKFYIERQRKTNVYFDSRAKVDELLYGTLTQKGRDIYLYIIHHLPDNQDYINLKIEHVRSKTSISRGAIITALQSLKKAGIITPKEQSIYWVNPFSIFSGNRINYFKSLGESYLKVVSVVKKENERA